MIVRVYVRDANSDELTPMRMILAYASMQPHRIRLFNNGLDMRMYLNRGTEETRSCHRSRAAGGVPVRSELNVKGQEGTGDDHAQSTTDRDGDEHGEVHMLELDGLVRSISRRTSALKQRTVRIRVAPHARRTRTVPSDRTEFVQNGWIVCVVGILSKENFHNS